MIWVILLFLSTGIACFFWGGHWYAANWKDAYLHEQQLRLIAEAITASARQTMEDAVWLREVAQKDADILAHRLAKEIALKTSPIRERI